MKSEVIHEGLEKRDIRDYLSQTLHKAVFNGGLGGEEHEKLIKKQIDELQQQLKQIKIYNTIEYLIEQYNWRWWDISDYVEYYTKDTYFDFIGTPEEFKSFMERKVGKNVQLRYKLNGSVDYKIISDIISEDD